MTEKIHPLKLIFGSFTALPIFVVLLLYGFLKWAIKHLIRLLGKLFCTFDALKWYLNAGTMYMTRLEFNKTLSDLDRQTLSKTKTKTP